MVFIVSFVIYLQTWGSVLGFFAREGSLSIVTALLQVVFKASDVEAPAPASRYTPLHCAAFSNNAGVLEKLLKTLSDERRSQAVGLAAAGGVTALHIAASQGSVDMSELILHFAGDKRASLLRARTDSGQTPLHIAVKNGHRPLVGKLLEHSGDDTESVEAFLDEISWVRMTCMDWPVG